MRELDANVDWVARKRLELKAKTAMCDEVVAEMHINKLNDADSVELHLHANAHIMLPTFIVRAVQR